MEVLTDILGSLRLTGGVVMDGRLTGEFCVLSHFTPDHCAPFFPMPETLIGYHYVRSGTMMVIVDGYPTATVNAGEIAILPRNDPHMLARRPGLPPADASEVGWTTRAGLHCIESGGEGEVTEVWCGFLGTARSAAHPLLAALPPLLTLDVHNDQEEWLDSSLRFLAKQKPSPEVVARLAEVLLTQAVQEYVQALPADEGGWLAGLRDPAVARALAVIHRRFAEDLDIELLAKEAGVSRSVLGERFVDLLGEPPMRYCAHWRMRMAANMLRDGKDNNANIAYAVGFNSEAAFNRAFKREYGEPPATWRRHEARLARAQRAAAVQPELPEQVVQYCTAKDGTKLAYSVVGTGPPLVKTANWLNHIEHDWDSPLWRHWLAELCQHNGLIRYDERGNGLSDWETPEMSLDAFVEDLETVVDCVGLDQFDLLAISQGAAVAVAFAVRHPKRVRRLVICNGYAAGWQVRGDPKEVARREAMLTLCTIGWGLDNPTYRQMFTGHYIPEASPRQMEWFNQMQRLSASPENAVRLQRTLSTLDVRQLLPQVRTPTLIFHSRHDQAVPYSEGEHLAANIPGATFIPLDSRNHILLATEPAWHEFASETKRFLGQDAPSMSPLREFVG